MEVDITKFFRDIMRTTPSNQEEGPYLFAMLLYLAKKNTYSIAASTDKDNEEVDPVLPGISYVRNLPSLIEPMIAAGKKMV